jgi:hypothetical protein
MRLGFQPEFSGVRSERGSPDLRVLEEFRIHGGIKAREINEESVILGMVS